jgi:hypothetical protein
MARQNNQNASSSSRLEESTMISPSQLKQWVGISGPYDFKLLSDEMHRRGLHKSIVKELAGLTLTLTLTLFLTRTRTSSPNPNPDSNPNPKVVIFMHLPLSICFETGLILFFLPCHHAIYAMDCASKLCVPEILV